MDTDMIGRRDRCLELVRDTLRAYSLVRRSARRRLLVVPFSGEEALFLTALVLLGPGLVLHFVFDTPVLLALCCTSLPLLGLWGWISYRFFHLAKPSDESMGELSLRLFDLNRCLDDLKELGGITKFIELKNLRQIEVDLLRIEEKLSGGV